MRKVILPVVLVPLLFFATCTVRDTSPFMDMANAVRDMAGDARDALADAASTVGDAIGVDLAMARDASAAPPTMVMCNKVWTQTMGTYVYRWHFAEIPAFDPRLGGRIDAWSCDYVDGAGATTNYGSFGYCTSGWTCDAQLTATCGPVLPEYDSAKGIFRFMCGLESIIGGKPTIEQRRATRIYYTITP